MIVNTLKWFYVISTSLVLGTASMAYANTAYMFEFNSIDGGKISLSEYKGNVILVVNTASECGFTPQFEGLEKLYSDYKDKNFVVLGFPSGDFNQEYKDEGKTAELCELTYGVKFPMFETIAVRGDDADPLYRLLAEKADAAPKWNFYKYLVDRKGNLVDSYSSFTKPQDEDLIADIERAIQP